MVYSLNIRNIGVDRKCVNDKYRKIDKAINDIARSHSNIKVFDVYFRTLARVHRGFHSRKIQRSMAPLCIRFSVPA